jgi:outer membrane protein assembly factor BamB
MDIQPLHTKVDKSIQTTVGEIVLENHSGFPRGESNLYCIAPYTGKIVWNAEKPDPYTLYSRVRLNEDGATMSAYTIGGHACELDPKTGKLISHTVIK